jgi:hypothetical protein
MKVRGQLHAPTALPPGKQPTEYEAGWTAVPVWTQRSREISPTSGNRTSLLGDVWVSGGTAPLFLTSAVDGGGQLHTPAALSPDKEHPSAHWIGGCMDPRAGLDIVNKRKIS